MSLLDIVFPKNCLNCKKSGIYVCKECLAKVKQVKPICPMCEKASIDGFTHIKCKKKYGIDGLASLWGYEGVIKKAIISLKYKYATDIVNELVVYSVKVLGDGEVLVPDNYILVPIPMHRLRENIRGFNQSFEVGRNLAKRMKWKFVPNLLVRKKLNKPQAQLSENERNRNIRGVFSVDVDNYLISNSSIILFDDVYTTGATLKEAGKLLKQKGAKSVWGLTLAH